MSDKRLMRTTIGGQALLEGIIMLGPEKSAIVVRRSDGGLEIKEEAISASSKNTFLTMPFIRGTVNLFRSMKRGIAALTYSAQFFDDGESEEEPGKIDKWLEEKFGSEKMERYSMSFALILGILIPIGLFILLPTLIAGILPLHTVQGSITKNLIEGIVRIIIFLGFLLSISKMKDIKRTFMYHGAEHKSIHCYESGKELTVENAQKFPRQHPRCGTSFLFVVMIISILLFSLVPWANPILRMLVRLLLLPVVIGISYEINRFAGRHDNWFTNILRAPGLWMQSFTTFEPDDSMVEVAIEALTRVIPFEQGADEW
ncbi:MAG: DUF1385 domain-containing protein [Clostridiales bacterium]|nr:DUF1385 domain-containing protein [Clostridiales bacterium]